MDLLNWFNDDAEVSPQIQRYKEIEKWIDNEIGAFDYFGIRALVKSAADNTLKEDYPDVPYTAKEILQWAEWNDKSSFFMTPGGQAIDGEQTSDYFFGAPAVDPRTGERNTTAEQNGVIVEFAKSSANSLFKVGLALAAVALLYQYSSAKVKKMA